MNKSNEDKMLVEISNVKKTDLNSLEIALMTGKRHDHIMRDIKNMLAQLEIDAPNFGDISKDRHGRDLRIFKLDGELTLTLLTGYYPRARYALVKRWHELERNPVPTLPQTIEEVQQHLITLQEQRITSQVRSISARKGGRSRSKNLMKPILKEAGVSAIRDIAPAFKELKKDNEMLRNPVRLGLHQHPAEPELKSEFLFEEYIDISDVL